jgi:hypothetical protein
MMSILDRIGVSITQLAEESADDSAEPDSPISSEQIVSEFEDASNSYHMKIENEDGAFYFELNPGYFEDVSTGVPSDYSEYTVFAEVEHCFRQNEKEYVVDLMNILPQNDRKQKVEMRQMWHKITSFLNEIPGRKFSANEFYLSAPDIRLTPIAIYK